MIRSVTVAVGCDGLGVLTQTRYYHTYRCGHCGAEWETWNLSPDKADPCPCPECDAKPEGAQS
jgi:DNA-directed RNA polymerase subunit RPC12/RpoP